MAGKKKGATPKQQRKALERAAELRAALPGRGHNGGPRLRADVYGSPGTPLVNLPYSGLDAGSTGRRLTRFQPRTEHVLSLIHI